MLYSSSSGSSFLFYGSTLAKSSKAEWILVTGPSTIRSYLARYHAITVLLSSARLHLRLLRQYLLSLPRS